MDQDPVRSFIRILIHDVKKIRYGSGANFHTDPDPGKKGLSISKILKMGYKQTGLPESLRGF